ncbi:hypothetical protein C4572_04560 [Candidatus Parcubacteria bacterium]|nr:MAG: hypothetical protein C4572_04560 [Candidatus Parcubacteria bacterium]
MQNNRHKESEFRLEQLGSRTAVVIEPNVEAEHRVGGLNPTIVFAGLNATGKDYLAKALTKDGFNARVLGFGDLLSQSMNLPKEQLPKLKPEEFEKFYPRGIESRSAAARGGVARFFSRKILVTDSLYPRKIFKCKIILIL